MVAQATTGPQQLQQAPWNPRKQDADGDNMAVAALDVRLAAPLHHTIGHHLLDENPLSNMTYLTIKRRNKHKNIETTLKLKICVGRKHTKYTAELVSSLDTLALDIPEELAVMTEASPTPGALKNGNWITRKEKNNERYSTIS